MPVSPRVFGTLGDDRPDSSAVLVRGLAQVCVEALTTDAQREVASASLPVLNLPDAAALDHLASRGAVDGTVRGGDRVRVREGFDGDFEVRGQGRDGAEAFSDFDVDACETDAAQRAVAQLTKAWPR